jgi:hypothetical protein
MALDNPPADVGQLVARVKTSTGNIARHLTAMREVAVQAKLNPGTEPAKEVTKQ